ncbi:MAG: MFS transporter [Acidimicrobiaceae bacterium]|nr:MFS transporter [Acidimicrobiaceae bacterium]
MNTGNNNSGGSGSGGNNAGDSSSGARWAAFGYLFTLYFILGGTETLMSPLFPLAQPDLELTESNLAAILASVSAGTATFNVLGGISSRRLSERALVRASAMALAAAMLLSATAQTFWVLLVGQTLLGVAFGIFFPPALAGVARLYKGLEGKAIAAWGQAYSFGLTAAALSVFAGGRWRWVFVGCAMPALLAVAYVPRWPEADRAVTQLPWLAQLMEYTRKQTYRLAGYASFGGVSLHFVVIGFSPVFFEGRGVDLRLVGVLLAAGRFLSAPVKLLGGVAYDRKGGPWTARLMMACATAVGLPMLLAPADVGVWLLVPFVGVAVSVMPVANAMLVAALPPQSGFGIGTFRAALLGTAALLSALVSGLLSLGVPLSALMLTALGSPALVAGTMHRATT